MLRWLHVHVLDESGEPKRDHRGDRVPLPETRPKLREELSPAEIHFYDVGLGRESEERHAINVARFEIERQALIDAGRRILAKEASGKR